MSRRPHWLPEIVWMGIKVGEWPIMVFSTEDQARRWASETGFGDRERYYWSVAVPQDTVVFTAETIPASTKARQVYP